MRHSILAVVVLISCADALPSLRTAAQVRDELCAMAPLLPASTEVDKFKAACALSAPLSDVAAAFERCDGVDD